MKRLLMVLVIAVVFLTGSMQLMADLSQGSQPVALAQQYDAGRCVQVVTRCDGAQRARPWASP